MQDHEPQGLCESIASPTAGLHGLELQAWQQHSAAKLLVGLRLSGNAFVHPFLWHK